MKEKALEYLNKDRLSNIDMIEQIRRGIGELTYCSNKGVMLTFDDGRNALISSDDIELVAKLISEGKFDMVELHDSRMTEEISERFGYNVIQKCWQGVYTKEDLLPMDNADIRLLDSSWLDFLAEVYEHGDREYLELLIGQELIYGIFENGELAGFIGRHSEGAIGLLEILPQYRRRGLAEKLNSFYINLEKSKGHIPYGQIIVGNDASRKLQEKLGLEFAEKTVCWLWRE